MKSKHFKITGFKLGLIITMLIAGLYVSNAKYSNVKLLHLIELKALDYRFLLRGKIEPKSPVVIVGIDDKSIKQLGRWPWPRSYIAGLIDFMTEADAKVVGFDVTFSEPDMNSELMLLNEINKKRESWDIQDGSFDDFLEARKKKADNDQILADAIRRNGRVVLGFFFLDEKTEGYLDEASRLAMTQNYDKIKRSKLSETNFNSEEALRTEFEKFNTADVNIQKISDAALGFGYFNIFPDIDGTIRWEPLVVRYVRSDDPDDDTFPSLFAPLSLQVIREYLRKEGDDLEDIKVNVKQDGINEIKLHDYIIPTDDAGRMMINFRGPARTFPHHSFVDIVNLMKDETTPKSVLKEKKGVFKDKIVIVGATSTGIYDMRVTPFSSVYPGVETHANVIDNILTKSMLVSPVWAKVVDLLTILILGLAVSFTIPKHNATRSARDLLATLIAYVVLNYILFAIYNIWLNLVYPVMTVTFTPLILYTYRFATEERKAKLIRGAFSSYVSESVVNEILKNPDKLELGGEKKDLTVLFSDIRGFTSISEELSPHELVSLLNQYLTEMTKSVFRYEGTLDKYMGDAIMAFYGAPNDQPDHPIRACRTALDMMRALRKLQRQWEQKDMPKMDIGIGLNTGSMSVGNMGSEVMFDYTVMGDNVNLGSRLEGINKQYGSNIIISESTYERVKDDIIVRQLDVVRVKGKQHPVKIYQLIANQRFIDKDSKNRRYLIKRRLHKKFKDRRFEDKNIPDRRTGINVDYRIMCSQFDEAMKSYFARDFVKALDQFKALDKEYPDDKPAKMFIRRVEEFIKNPPTDDWDGVFTMTTK